MAAYSYVKYTGDGATVLFSIPYPYLDKSHIEVRVGGALQAVTTDYTFPSPTQIQFGSPPANGAVVEIRRNSNRASRVVDFQNGAKLTEATLDRDSNQGFFIAQEAFDHADESLASLLSVVNLSTGDALLDVLESNAPGQGASLIGIQDAAGNYSAINVEAALAEVWSKLYSATGTVGSALVRYIQSGAGAVARTTLAKMRDVVSVKDFGAVGDGTVDDTAAIQAAFDALAPYQCLTFPGAKYKINGCITVDTSNISVHFDNTTFLVGDTGTAGTMTNGATGKIGFLFKEVGNLNMTGLVRCYGQGTPGTTSLAGMVFDQCDNARVPCTMYFENMAAGRFIQWCDTAQFGDVYSKGMDGLQTFEEPPTNSQGSAEVIVGCVHSTFGIAQGYNCRKPVRYLSVAYDAESIAVNTQFCRFGATIGEGAAVTTETSVLSIRCAVDCAFGPVQGQSMGLGLQIVQYDGDADFSNTRNFIEAVTGTYISTAASADAAVSQFATGSMVVGSNTVGKVAATVAGEFGIYCDSGELTIMDASVSGATRGVVGQTCVLNFGRLQVDGTSQSHVTIGQACHFAADFIDLRGGTTGGVSGGVIYNPAFGSGGVGTIRIGAVKYNHGGVATDLQYVVLDTTNGFETWAVGNIQGTGSVAPARFGADSFSVKNGRLLSAAPPTTGTYSDGALVWNSAPAAAGTPGWVCTTPGTPGTWKAMAALAA